LIPDLNEHNVLVLVGPTAAGKTSVSLIVAEQLKAEIVSADSRQVYRYMDIGTAKPIPEDLARIPHHFIDIRNPDEDYSAGDYGRQARRCIKQLHDRNKRAVVVGGSGFYLRALLDGLFAPKTSDRATREKWRGRIREQGIEAVFDQLRKVDPPTAERLHPNDTQRVVRALEVWEISGKPISSFRKENEEPAPFPFILIGLTRDRERLYERINIRVDDMINQGLIEEVQGLREKGYSADLNALQTVGYKEVFAYLDGHLSLEAMTDEIKKNTRRYAKRQMTWFNKDSRIHWISIDSMEPKDIAGSISRILAEKM